ncbi:MAG: hypothetical protein R3D83_09250 [Caenibius sp.]
MTTRTPLSICRECSKFLDPLVLGRFGDFFDEARLPTPVMAA